MPLPPRFMIQAALAARRSLIALADLTVPASIAIFDTSIGTERSFVLGAVAELGIADLLAEGPADAKTLASRLEADPDVLHRLLRAAAAMRVVTLLPDGRFRETRLTKPLRSDAPVSMRKWCRYFTLPSTVAAWQDLVGSVRTGHSAFPRVHGRSVWGYYADHPEEGRTFAEAMRAMTTFDAPAVATAYPWPDRGTLCDVAGGTGTMLSAILARRAGLRGVLVDVKDVLVEAAPLLAARGLAERVELVEADIFASLPVTADLYLLKNVLHDWDDEACLRILKTVRSAMPCGSRVIVVEQLQERNKPDEFASLTDLQMLIQCDEGRERSAAELTDLLRRAGLRPGKVRRSPGVMALVDAVA
ncbi:MAG: methyltransferase [Frankiaceae bacterium]